ncbi:MAG: hypothetical protein Fur0043_28370 [Anaerolineales bacterium]
MRVVIGIMKGLDDGYVAYAREKGAAYFLPHPEVWNTLKSAFGDQAEETAWLVNQRALRPYIERGAPFEYTLRGVENLKVEEKVIELIWEGKTPDEIVAAVEGVKRFSTRHRELVELYQAGYRYTFDEMANAYILVKP